MFNKRLYTDQNQPFASLNNEKTFAIATTNDILISFSVLFSSHASNRIKLDINTYNLQVDSVLQQMQLDDRKPFGYWSWSLKNETWKQKSTKCEFLLIVWSEKLLQPYKERKRFATCVDYDSLEWILNPAHCKARNTLWNRRLSKFWLWRSILCWSKLSSSGSPLTIMHKRRR